MTTPSRITEIIEEMDQDPALADALRERILGQQFTEAIQSMLNSNTEMMTRQAELGEIVRDAMKAVTGSVVEIAGALQTMSSDIGRLEARADRTEIQSREEQGRIGDELNALQGTLDNVAGSGYEMKVASNLRSLLRQHLGLRNTRILKGPNREPDEEFTEVLERAQQTGLIGEEELGAALLLDVIARVNTPEGQTQYAAVEVSITVNPSDVARAEERAGTITAATGTVTTAVVIGTSADERAATMVAEGRARMVRYPAS